MPPRIFTTIILFNIFNNLILSAFGACVNYADCRAAVKYIKDINDKKIHESSVQVLKKSYCGSSGRNPLVECEAIPPCYQPSDKNFCVKVNDCCPALRLIKQNVTQNPEVKRKLNEYICDPNATEIEVRCSALVELEEILLRQAANENACITPSGLRGACVILEACPTFFGKPITRNYRDYKTRSSCDSKSKKICCAPNDNAENACGIDNEEYKKIFKGTPTEENEFPWVVILKYDNPDLVCGGTLINSQFVVTAGHCILEDLRRVKIGGSFQDEQNKHEYRILHQKLHPFYEEKPLKNDIALLQIDRVTYQKSVRWICLPPMKNVLPQEYVLVGSGEIGNGSLAKLQLKAKLPDKPTSICQEIFRYDFAGYDHFLICAGGSGADACKGDSGGPLQAQNDKFWSLYGVVSGGSPNCSEGTPGVYTRVDKFVNWIRNSMKTILEVEEKLFDQATENDVCITPNGLEGRCVSKELCPTFFGKPVTTNHKEYFAKSVCDKKKEKVCCAPNDSVDHVCGVDNENIHKISGENITAENEFPWVVILKYDNPKAICGGTLLNSQFVITAAHCLRKDLRKIQIAGKGKINPEYNILSMKASPYYQRRPLRNDIALLRIEKVVYQDNIKWICLPSSTNEALPRDYIVVGNRKTDNYTLSLHQSKATFPNRPTADCQRRYPNHFDNYENFIICAGGIVGVDNCVGHSGGPLMSKGNHPFWSLYGVVSGGSADCKDGSPDFYTRVDKFIDWIQNTMKDMLINK